MPPGFLHPPVLGQALPSGVDDAELQRACESVGVQTLLLQRLLGAAAASEVLLCL